MHMDPAANKKKQASLELRNLMDKYHLGHFREEFAKLGLFDIPDLLSVQDDKVLEDVGFGPIHRRAFWKILKDDRVTMRRPTAVGLSPRTPSRAQTPSTEEGVASSTSSGYPSTEEGMTPSGEMTPSGFELVSGRIEQLKELQERFSKITITVQVPNGKDFPVVVNRDTKISEVKQEIEKQAPEYSAAFQKLIIPDIPRKIVDDNQTISDALPRETSTIKLITVSWGSSAIGGKKDAGPWPPLETLTKHGCEVLSKRPDENDYKKSVSAMLKALEDGTESPAGGLAVVYSKEKEQYWLLYSRNKVSEKDAIMESGKRRYVVEMMNKGKERRHVEYDLHYGLPYRREYRLHPDHVNEPPFKQGTIIQIRDRAVVETEWKSWRNYYTILDVIYDQFVHAVNGSDGV